MLSTEIEKTAIQWQSMLMFVRSPHMSHVNHTTRHEPILKIEEAVSGEFASQQPYTLYDRLAPQKITGRDIKRHKFTFDICPLSQFR